MEDIWNTKFREAENNFLRESETHIWSKFFFSEVHFWRASLDDPVALEGYHDLSEKLEAALNTLKEDVHKLRETSLSDKFKSSFGLKKKSQTEKDGIHTQKVLRMECECDVILAELYLQKSLLLFKKQHHVKGAFYFHKSWKQFEAAQKLLRKCTVFDSQESSESPPQLEDSPIPTLSNLGGMPADRLSGHVKFGIGFFHFVVSLIPTSFRWVAEMLGFEGDRDMALDELRASEQSQCERATYASLILAWAHLAFLDDENTANEIFARLNAQYPTSAALELVWAFALRRQGKLQEAMELLQKAVESSEQVRQTQLTAEYELGHCYFISGEWEKAIPCIERYVNESRSPNFRAYGGFKLGFCYWMLGRSLTDIIQVYDQVPSWVRPNFSFDKYAQRMTESFLESNKFTEFEVLAIPALNCVEAQQWDRISELCDKMTALLLSSESSKSPGTPETELLPLAPDHPLLADERFGVVCYLRGTAFKGKENFEEARKWFEVVLSMEPSLAQEPYIVPHSLVELAEMGIKERDWDAAQSLFQDAKSFKGHYDFDKPLGYRISKGLQRVKAEKKKLPKA